MINTYLREYSVQSYDKFSNHPNISAKNYGVFPDPVYSGDRYCLRRMNNRSRNSATMPA